IVIFNVVACNTDAHAKNYSIMIIGAGPSVAPIYDVMCGEAWRHVTKSLAQKVASKNRGEQLAGQDWESFARECGLGPKQGLARVRVLAETAMAQAGTAAAEVASMPAGGHPILDEVRASIERRAQTLLAQLDEAKDEAEAGEPMLAAS